MTPQSLFMRKLGPIYWIDQKLITFEFFCNIMWENLNEHFDQPNINRGCAPAFHVGSVSTGFYFC